MDPYQGTNINNNNSGLFVDRQNLNSSQLFKGHPANREMNNWGSQSQPNLPNYQQISSSDQNFQQKPPENQRRDIVTNHSNVTFDRRHYPKNIIGAQSEWRGLEKHQEQVNFQLRKLEGDISHLKQKQLLTQLDRKMLFKHQLRREQLLQKSKETQIFQVRQKDYQDSLKKMQEDKQLVKSNLAVQYDTQMKAAMQKQMKQREKIKSIQNEQNQKARKLLQSEQRKRRILRDHQKTEFQKNIVLFEERKQKQKLDREMEKLQYNDMVKYNNIKDQIKEQNYKNFFKSVVKNQDHIQKHHIDHVLGPLLDKQRQLQAAFVSKANTVEARSIQLQLNKIRAQKEELFKSRDTNKMLIAEHQQRKELQRIEKMNQAARRLEQQLKYQEMEDFQRRQQEEQKLQYKDFLQKQNRENEQLKLNNQRMTRNQKGLNYVDLQAFKTYDPGLYSMLPGWSPQIGQLPPKENRELMQQRVMNELKKKHQIQPNMKTTQSELQLLDKGAPINLKESLFSSMAQNSLTPSMSVGQFKPFQKIGEPIQRYENEVNRGGRIDSQNSLHARGNSHQFLQSIPNHNPITNALNMNYYNNPYIRKEIMRGSNQNKNQVYNSSNNTVIGNGNNNHPGINTFNPFHHQAGLNSSTMNIKETSDRRDIPSGNINYPTNNNQNQNVNQTIL